MKGSMVSILVLSLAVPALADSIELETRPVLIPIVAGTIAGRGGELWKTTIYVHNNDRNPGGVTYLTPPQSGCADPCTTPVALPAGATAEATAWYDESGAPTGLVVDVERAFYEDVSISARIQETNSPSDFFGVALPIVRDHDFHEGRVVLLDAPATDGARLTLRIYSLYTHSDRATIRFFDLTTGKLLETVERDLFAPESDTQRRAGYAELSSIETAFPALAGHHLRIEISTELEDRKLWAMASVTNNVTHQITILTP